MNKEHLELYKDYLLSTFGYATATGLSRMVDGQVAHDQITRFLSAQEFTSKDLSTLVKPPVREVEQEEAVLIFDDTIQEKPYIDENEKRGSNESRFSFGGPSELAPRNGLR